MTELQKKLYDKLIIVSHYIRGKHEKQNNVNLDNQIFPPNIKVYADVYDKDLVDGSHKNNEDKDENE